MIFEVRGHVHPPNRIIAFLRYLLDPNGERGGKLRYRKIYDLEKRFKIIKHSFPHYILKDPYINVKLQAVPLSHISRVLDPVERLNEMLNSSVDNVEKDAVRLARLISEKTGIPLNAIGVSGSILPRLHTVNSDIDLVIYGGENCRKAYRGIKKLLEDSIGGIRRYNEEELKALYLRRSSPTVHFNKFKTHELRKNSQGIFNGREFFIRFIKKREEVQEKYGEVKYYPLSRATIQCIIEDDSESIFTPTLYLIKNCENIFGPKLPIKQIFSYRGRFCEQAIKNEKVVASGTIEQVTHLTENETYYRLILGNNEQDFMVCRGKNHE
ncbi:MAG: hypothetical protein ACTSPL_05995 [Candidatus Odinarchaeia archaeon]